MATISNNTGARPTLTPASKTSATPQKVRQTLEQQRAQNAWECAEGYDKERLNAAKSLPAMIMNSGLLQVMAYAHDKNRKAYGDVAQQLRTWLTGQFPKTLSTAEFSPFMRDLMNADPRAFQDITSEAFAWLRWLRQMAAARVKGD